MNIKLYTLYDNFINYSKNKLDQTNEEMKIMVHDLINPHFLLFLLFSQNKQRKTFYKIIPNYIT